MNNVMEIFEKEIEDYTLYMIEDEDQPEEMMIGIQKNQEQGIIFAFVGEDGICVNDYGLIERQYMTHEQKEILKIIGIKFGINHYKNIKDIWSLIEAI